MMFFFLSVSIRCLTKGKLKKRKHGKHIFLKQYAFQTRGSSAVGVSCESKLLVRADVAGRVGVLMPPSPTPSCDPRAAASALPPPKGSLFARFGSSLRLLGATWSEARFALTLPVTPLFLVGFGGSAGRSA